MLLALAGAATASAAQTAATDAGIAGEWIFEMTGDAQPQRVVLQLVGDTLRGRVYGQELTGRVLGSRVEFRVGSYRWRAALRGDTLTGWLGVDPDSSAWRGTRFRRPAVPRRFEFTPTSWERGVSATVRPVLRVAPGDTVRTSTLDAGGWSTGAFGERGNRPSPGGNPLVGPFYVEGAVPGDVLVLRLHRVRLNRTWAFSGTELIDQAVDQGYARDRKYANTDNKWTLDTATATARLTTPTPALKDWRVPLRPFLGVVAVAPSQQFTPSSRDAGSYGGNMESAHLAEGAVVYL
ncbi:MAG: acetamidase/formamidase family protein, partial [Gemmatimonadaceae bacterium]|nr:acetamidase/formamidase family protein [Gemmatimonadaceae bacterium]